MYKSVEMRLGTWTFKDNTSLALARIFNLTGALVLSAGKTSQLAEDLPPHFVKHSLVGQTVRSNDSCAILQAHRQDKYTCLVRYLYFPFF